MCVCVCVCVHVRACVRVCVSKNYTVGFNLAVAAFYTGSSVPLHNYLTRNRYRSVYKFVVLCRVGMNCVIRGMWVQVRRLRCVDDDLGVRRIYMVG